MTTLIIGIVLVSWPIVATLVLFAWLNDEWWRVLLLVVVLSSVLISLAVGAKLIAEVICQ